MTKPFSTVLDEALRKVRDAGALDDNNGAEDWTHSDTEIEKANAIITAAVREHVIGKDEVGEPDTPEGELFYPTRNGLRTQQRANLNIGKEQV